MSNKFKLLLLGIATCTALFVWLVIVTIKSNAGRTGIVTIEVIPSDASIKINDKKARGGKNKVVPGDITVSVSKKGFATETRKATVIPNVATYVGVVLASNSPATANWYTTHITDQKKAEGISSQSFDAAANLQLATTPLVQQLPYVSAKLEYRVDFGPARDPNKSNQPVIFIKAYTAEDRKNALRWIRSYGYDPATMDIVFVSAINPFNGERT